MTITNYSSFSKGVTIGGVPLAQAYPGQVFWVNNSSTPGYGAAPGSNSNEGSYLRPFSTMHYAASRVSAGRGDIVYVMPNHVETVATAAALALAVTGCCVVGLGVGSARPKVNLTATGGYVGMSAANCCFKNILFTGGIDAITKMISVSAADCVIEDCELRDVTGQMTDGIVTTAGADRLKILNHTHKGDTAAGTNAAIALVGGDRIEITAKQFDGNFAVGGIDVRTTATTNLYVHDVGRFYTRNSADIFLIDTVTGSTGQIGPNLNLRLTDNAANITEACTGATFVYMQPINIVNLAGESSMQSNITASTDA